MNKDRREPEYPTELESQFILRLPDEPAKTLREVLQCGENLKNRLTIQVDSDMRHGEVRFDHWLMHGKIVDLPTIVESLKTIDNKSFYKTADICQMMICKDEPDQQPSEEEPAKNKKKDPYKVDKKFLWPHGVTPPTKNIRKRRFRKTLKKKYVEAPEIEKEVKRLLRADNEAVSVSWEVIKDEEDESGQSAQTVVESSTSVPVKPDKKGKGRNKKETAASKSAKASSSKASTSKASSSKASTSKASTSKASTSKASTSKASAASASKDNATATNNYTAKESKANASASASMATLSIASTSTAGISMAGTSMPSTSTAHEPSNVVDIFGGAVSDSDGEDEHVNVEVVQRQISGYDGNMPDTNTMITSGGKHDSYSTSFDSQIFQTPKSKGRRGKKTSKSKAPAPSTSVMSKIPEMSSEDDDYQSRGMNKDNDNDMTLRIEQLRTELEELKQRRQRTQHEIAGMENLALRQRFQDILHTLNQDIMYKEMEYQGMITLQNSEDI